MTIGKLLKEQSEYIAALYSIVFALQIREFERNDDPHGAAMAMANEMRQKLLNSGSDEEAMSRLVIEFFDEVVADLHARGNGGANSPGSPSVKEGSA